MVAKFGSSWWWWQQWFDDGGHQLSRSLHGSTHDYKQRVSGGGGSKAVFACPPIKTNTKAPVNAWVFVKIAICVASLSIRLEGALDICRPWGFPKSGCRLKCALLLPHLMRERKSAMLVIICVAGIILDWDIADALINVVVVVEQCGAIPSKMNVLMWLPPCVCTFMRNILNWAKSSLRILFLSRLDRDKLMQVGRARARRLQKVK